MSCCPSPPNPFAFTMPTTWYRPLPIVADEQPPSPPPPFVLPATIIADEYVAPYLNQPIDAVGTTTHTLGKRSLDAMQNHGSWLDAIASSSLRTRRDSACSDSSSSTCTSLSSASTSTEKRYKPNQTTLPYLPPIRRASTGKQKPTLPPLSSVLPDRSYSIESITTWQQSITTPAPAKSPSSSKLPMQAKQKLCKWFLIACNHPRRHPYPTASELTSLVQMTGLTTNQIRNWLTKTKKTVGWNRTTCVVDNPEAALRIAAELDVDLPDDFSLPTTPKLTLNEKMELYERGGLPFRGVGCK